MKMADMVASNYDLILMLPRFGIPLGFGDKSVREVCRESGVDETLFLTVCNIYTFDDYQPDDEEMARVDSCLVAEHLQASHRYYTEERLPHMERHLDHIVERAGEKSATILKKYFADYCREVRDHVRREEKNLGAMLEALRRGERVAEGYQKSHDNIKDKLADLTQIILKYIPGERLNEEMMELVFDIMQLSRDLEKHAEIEEMLLLPPEDYQLSDREQDVLELVAQGLSSKEIASKLSIAVNTVNTHRKSITRKTGIKSVAGLAVYWKLKIEK